MATNIGERKIFKVLGCLEVGKIFSEISTHQRPILVLVYP